MNQPLPTPETPNPELPNSQLPDYPITQSPRSAKSPLFYVIGGLVLLAVLAAVAFLAGKFIREPEPAANQGFMVGPNGEMLPGAVVAIGPGGDAGGGMVVGGSGDIDTMSMSIQIEPAPELPTYEPEVMGILVRREDNSLFIGTGGMVAISISGGEGESLTVEDPAYDGDEIEVIIEKETKIYLDTTQLEPPSQVGEMPSGTIQQTVTEGSLDEINDQTMLIVWGRKTGDRVIADVLFYSQPAIFTMPAAPSP